DCISFFYDSGDFLEKCSSFINSGYTRPRTRITNIEGIWKRTGDLVYVQVRSSAGLSGERKSNNSRWFAKFVHRYSFNQTMN
ncbi:MAG: hypothetical protein ACKPGH_03655, partial [Dolichospermum sp.]